MKIVRENEKRIFLEYEENKIKTKCLLFSQLGCGYSHSSWEVWKVHTNSVTNRKIGRGQCISSSLVRSIPAKMNQALGGSWRKSIVLFWHFLSAIFVPVVILNMFMFIIYEKGLKEEKTEDLGKIIRKRRNKIFQEKERKCQRWHKGVVSGCQLG